MDHPVEIPIDFTKKLMGTFFVQNAILNIFPIISFCIGCTVLELNPKNYFKVTIFQDGRQF
jgi:hypothetical protein